MVPIVFCSPDQNNSLMAGKYTYEYRPEAAFMSHSPTKKPKLTRLKSHFSPKVAFIGPKSHLLEVFSSPVQNLLVVGLGFYLVQNLLQAAVLID